MFLQVKQGQMEIAQITSFFLVSPQAILIRLIKIHQINKADSTATILLILQKQNSNRWHSQLECRLQRIYVYDYKMLEKSQI